MMVGPTWWSLYAPMISRLEKAGYTVVPLEPHHEMAEAGIEFLKKEIMRLLNTVDMGDPLIRMTELYKAMIAKRPVPWRKGDARGEKNHVEISDGDAVGE